MLVRRRISQHLFQTLRELPLHAEEAAFLWILRDAAVQAPHYSLNDLADSDERVEAHIDGLRVAGEAVWSFCADALAQEEPGEVFAASVLARV